MPFNLLDKRSSVLNVVALVLAAAGAVAGVRFLTGGVGLFIVFCLIPLYVLSGWRANTLAKVLDDHWQHHRGERQLDMLVGKLGGKGVFAPVWKDRTHRLYIGQGALHLQDGDGNTRSYDARSVTVGSPSLLRVGTNISTGSETFVLTALPRFDAGTWAAWWLNRTLATVVRDAVALNGGLAPGAPPAPPASPAPPAQPSGYPAAQPGPAYAPQQPPGPLPYGQTPSAPAPAPLPPPAPSPPPAPGALPAGWYPDPSGQAAQRWWDGSAWTEHTGG